MTRKEKIDIIKRAVVCVATCAAVIGGAYLVLRMLGLTDVTREEIQDIVAGTGAWAPLAFILVSFLQVTFVPIYVFIARLNMIDTYMGIIIPNLVSAYFIFMLRGCVSVRRAPILLLLLYRNLPRRDSSL